MEKIAIIGSGYMAMIIAKRAKELGIESHCFSFDNNSIASQYCDYFHLVDIFDIDTISKIIDEYRIGGVVATTELTIYPAAQIASRNNLNGNPISVAKEITDKTTIRNKIVFATKVKQPNFYVCKDGDKPEIKKYPVIVKPISAGGKRGITVVKEKEQLSKSIDEALKVSKIKGVLIEEFLEHGYEYSVESLSFKGEHFVIQVTQKDSSGPPKCVELGHHQPASLSYEMRQNVEEAIIEMLSLVGIENGPCHTEIKIINEDIYLIEINGRPGGDHIAYPLTELSTGYQYITGIIECALDKLDVKGLKDIINTKNKYAGVHFVTKQTAYLEDVFEKCDNYDWLYKKNKVTDDLMEITHNDGYNINYFIYCSDKERPMFQNNEV